MCTLLVEYVPSLQRAVAPAGAPAGERTVGIAAGAALPDGVAAGASLRAGAVRFVERLEVDADFVALRVERGVADVRLVFAGVRAVAAVDRDDVFRVVIRLATPPCAEHRPLEDVAVEYVPS